MAGLDTGFTSSFSSASILLQVQLGTGLVLSGFGAALAQNADLRKRLEGVAWEPALRSASRAAAPGSLLAAHALVQVQGAKSDILTASGLGMCSVALLTAVVLEPALGAKLTKVLEAIRGIGQALLLFGNMPGGAELWSATCFIRLVLLLRSVSAISAALGKDCSCCDCIGDLEPVLALAPLAGALSLLNHFAWGSMAFWALPTQFAPYCLALLGFLLVARFALGASISTSSSYVPALQLEGGLGKVWSTLSGVAAAGMALSLVSAMAGIFSFSLSASDVTIRWGDILLAGSAEVLLLLVLTQIGGMMFSSSATSEDRGSKPLNGMDVTSSAPTSPGSTASFLDYLVPLVAPAETLALAMIAIKMSNEDSEGGILTLPFTYGILLAPIGVLLQVVSLVAFSSVSAGATPNFDVSGTLVWQGKDLCCMSLLRSATIFSLEIGLFLGCLGLGVFSFVLGSLCAGGLFFAVAAPDTRQRTSEVGQKLLGTAFSGIEALLEQQRAARAAAAAQRASAMAQALEAEAATKASKAAGKAAATKASAPAAFSAQKSAGGSKRKGK